MRTNIGLSENTVDTLTLSLSSYQSDLFVLYVRTLNFHWNMEDPRFIALHKFLEEQYNELQEMVDMVAERIRILGRKAPAQLKSFLDQTELSESSTDLSGDAMLDDLAAGHEQCLVKARKIISQSDSEGDTGTADMLTQVLRFHEKTAWMLRSHL